MYAKRFEIVPGCPGLAKKMARAIHEAAVESDTLVIDPGKYTLDEPVHLLFDSHHTENWGISGFGASVKAVFTDAAPLMLWEAKNGAQCRNFSIDGLAIRAQNRSQQGIKWTSPLGSAFYRFALNRLTTQGCDDGMVLEGNVFEADITYPSSSDNNCALALGNVNDAPISAINVFGGSLSQNFVDGMRTYSDVAYREPYDFQMFGTYIGNNGRYSINARAGVQLLKGVRLENPWTDPATHDPDNKIERACVKLANYGTLEQCVGGGNGNATTLVDGYLSGNPLTMRECSIYSDRGLKVKIAKLDGNEGKARARLIGCRQPVEYSNKVVVEYVQ